MTRPMKTINLIGVFDDEETLVNALHQLKDKDIPIKEVFTPYPVHHVFTLLERRSRLSWAAFVYGFLAVVSVLSFLYYTAVVDWPLNFGGKPTNAFPSFIVVTLILTILSITLLSLFTFSVRAVLYPGKTASMPDPRSTDDKFIIVVGNSETSFVEVASLMNEQGATEVYEKPEE